MRLGGEMVERGGGGHAADDIDETQARLRNSRDLINYYCYLLLTLLLTTHSSLLTTYEHTCAMSCALASAKGAAREPGSRSAKA